MKLIAHRGNTHGPDEGKENNTDYIDKSLSEGYDAEIDVRYDHLGRAKNTYTLHVHTW